VIAGTLAVLPRLADGRRLEPPRQSSSAARSCRRARACKRFDAAALAAGREAVAAGAR
jgi:hypothetical protein